MARTERPLDPDADPVQAFAADLRSLRERAGRPTYQAMARRAHRSSSSLSEAAGGRKLPTLDTTLAYVRTLGGDETAWARRWHEVAARTPDPAPDDLAPPAAEPPPPGAPSPAARPPPPRLPSNRRPSGVRPGTPVRLPVCGRPRPPGSRRVRCGPAGPTVGCCSPLPARACSWCSPSAWPRSAGAPPTGRRTRPPRPPGWQPRHPSGPSPPCGCATGRTPRTPGAPPIPPSPPWTARRCCSTSG